MKLFLTTTILCSAFLVRAQSPFTQGSRSASLASSNVTLVDEWSTINNVGATGRLDRFSIGLSSENKFLISELLSNSLVCNVPLKKGVLSGSLLQFGMNNYIEYQAGLSYGLALSDKISAGVRMGYQGVDLGRYGSSGALVADIGFLAKLHDQLDLGFSVKNLNRAKYSRMLPDRIDTEFALGINYKIGEEFTSMITLFKTVNNPLSVRVGAEYSLNEIFALRGGVSGKPLQGSFGLGMKWNWIQINAGSSYQQVMGWAPHLGFSILKL